MGGLPAYLGWCWPAPSARISTRRRGRCDSADSLCLEIRKRGSNGWHVACTIVHLMLCAPPFRLNLTHCLVGFALLAGCHGMEPLAVNSHDPLRRDDRDVLVAGRGCSEFCDGVTSAAGRGDIPGIGGSAPVRPSIAGSQGVAGRGASPGTGVAGRPSRGFPDDLPQRSLCGNGSLDADESCDSSNLNAATCLSLGYAGGGSLSCLPERCVFDVSRCHLQPAFDAGLEEDGGQ